MSMLTAYPFGFSALLSIILKDVRFSSMEHCYRLPVITSSNRPLKRQPHVQRQLTAVAIPSSTRADHRCSVAKSSLFDERLIHLPEIA